MNTRNFKKAFVDFKRTELLCGSLGINEFVNPKLQIKRIYVRLSLRDMLQLAKQIPLQLTEQ